MVAMAVEPLATVFSNAKAMAKAMTKAMVKAISKDRSNLNV